MKRIIFLILLSFIVMPFSVDAASVSVSLECPASAKVGTNISCKVNVSSDAVVNGLSGNYTFNGLSYVSFAPQNGFVSYAGDSASGFAVGNNSGKTGNFTIGILTLKVNSAGSVQIKNLDASDTAFNSYNAGTRTANIRVMSTVDTLGGLTIDGGTLSPAFSSTTYNYTATVNSSTVTINALKGDNYQTITGGGVKNLNYGVNTFNVIATSESGSSKTYVITITRPDNRSSNNYLKSLTVSPGGINFDSSTTKYNVSVASHVGSVKITASLDDSRSTFASGTGPRTVNLAYGNNTIIVKAIAENGAVRTYTINVNRKDDRSTNNDLKSLKINKGKINFNKDTLEYNLSVYNDVSKIEVEALADDNKSVVTINNPELIVGDNVITIDVKSENGVVKTYKINVKRLSEEEKMSDNNNVSSIKVLGYELNFIKDIYDYELEIDNDDKELIVDVVLEDESANYIINGNSQLKDGSVVTVVIISESGLSKEYKITIIKKNDILIYLLIGGIGILIGAVVGILVYKLMCRRSKNVSINTTSTVLSSKEEKVKEVNVERIENDIDSNIGDEIERKSDSLETTIFSKNDDVNNSENSVGISNIVNDEDVL